MRAQYGRCSFSKIDFIPASGFDELDDGVMNIAMQYSLRGRDAFQVVNDAIRSVAEDLGVNSLNTNFDHVMLCIARGTTYGGRGTEWLAFAPLNGYTSVFNSGRCDRLSAMMQEIGHNLGLANSAGSTLDDPNGDTTGVVSSAIFVPHFRQSLVVTRLDLKTILLHIGACCLFVLKMGYR